MASLSGVFKLSGVALVTGAGGTGIGAAVAKGFIHSGCTRIAITDISEHTLNATKIALKELNPAAQVLATAGDISDEAFVDALFENVASTFGQLDYAVNCAGILGPSLRSGETEVEVFDRINRVNYRGCWLSSRAELRLMLKNTEALPEHPLQKGAVVSIASQLGVVGRSEATPYCASKAAVINMTRCDAIDYSRDDIRVNCVCPGVIETPMTTGSPEQIARLKSAVDIAPMRRMGQPEEIASACLFLCSGQASFVQGHALVVDGGYTIN